MVGLLFTPQKVPRPKKSQKAAIFLSRNKIRIFANSPDFVRTKN